MKTILITGASSGIGKATAMLFAKKGWNVVAGMRNPEQQKEKTDNFYPYVLDVGDFNSIENAVHYTRNTFGSIDAVVNSAGYGLFGVFESIEMDEIKKQYEVNVFGTMKVAQAVLPIMREQGEGIVVNISSFGGIIGLPFGTPYNSSKFAVEGFSEALANEVSRLNIAVKIIEPGSIDTGFRSNMHMVGGNIEAYQPILANFFPRYAKMTENIRKNTAEEVAETIFNACTDGSSQLRYVSGKDADFFINLKYQNNEADYVSLIRSNLNN